MTYTREDLLRDHAIDAHVLDDSGVPWGHGLHQVHTEGTRAWCECGQWRYPVTSGPALPTASEPQ